MKSYTIVFGTLPGQYPICNCVTDSILKRKTLSHFILDDVTINRGVRDRQNKLLGTLDLNGCVQVAQDSTLTLVFE